MIKLNEKGIQYLKKQTHFSIYLDKKKDDIDESISKSTINDDKLRDILLELRKKVADKNKIPPSQFFKMLQLTI